VGVIAYNRKEGRALGEVTKFLVYNARKRQEGGDSAATYFERTECVAGVQDARFQQLMPDVLHWLGIRRIDRLMSMSNMKYDAIVNSGIEVGERVPIPPSWCRRTRRWRSRPRRPRATTRPKERPHRSIR
jgi:GTP cyclohydrolase II